MKYAVFVLLLVASGNADNLGIGSALSYTAPLAHAGYASPISYAGYGAPIGHAAYGSPYGHATSYQNVVRHDQTIGVKSYGGPYAHAGYGAPSIQYGGVAPGLAYPSVPYAAGNVLGYGYNGLGYGYGGWSGIKQW